MTVLPPELKWIVFSLWHYVLNYRLISTHCIPKKAPYESIIKLKYYFSTMTIWSISNQSKKLSHGISKYFPNLILHTHYTMTFLSLAPYSNSKGLIQLSLLSKSALSRWCWFDIHILMKSFVMSSLYVLITSLTTSIFQSRWSSLFLTCVSYASY